jgi:hypothetical protein
MVCFVLIFVYQMIADFGAEGFASCASDGLIILWKVYGYRHSHISKGVRLTYPGAHCVFSGACIITVYQRRIWPDLLEGLEVFQRGCTTTWVRGHSPPESF